MTSAPARIGPYRVGEVLGRGGMGVVYRGEDEATGAAVAIKLVSGASRPIIAGIRREIHALGQVAHPGVVRVIEQGVTAGLPWYAMELLEGGTLRAVLDEHWRADPSSRDRWTPPTAAYAKVAVGGRAPGRPASPVARPPATRALDLCVELCEPLAAVHAAGLVHRDLKPENVFITGAGRPVLIDFGIAASFGGARGREVLAAAGDVAGTLEYMAPEQLRGELVDARTDLYALGVMLCQQRRDEPARRRSVVGGRKPRRGRAGARCVRGAPGGRAFPGSTRGRTTSCCTSGFHGAAILRHMGHHARLTP